MRHVATGMRRFVGRCRRGAMVALFVMPLMWGCGDLTSGGIGEVEVIVAADSLSTSTSHVGPASTSGVGPATAGRSGPGPSAGSDQIEGTVTVWLQVFVRGGQAHWEELTDGVQEVVLTLGESQSVLLGRRIVRSGRYDEVRVVFRRAEANVQRGLIVDGEPVEGRVLVFSDNELELAWMDVLEFDVREGALASIVLELQASEWLRRFNRDQQRVGRDDFREAVRIRTLADP